MAIEYDTNGVLYRRGGFNFINSYSPTGTPGQDYLIGDGIVNDQIGGWGNGGCPYPLSKWDNYYDENYPSVYRIFGYNDGAYFEQQSTQYCRKIKLSNSTPYGYAQIKFYLHTEIGVKHCFTAKTDNGDYSPQNTAANFNDNGVGIVSPLYFWRDGVTGKQGDMVGPIGYSGIEIKVNSKNSDFFDFFPKRNYIGWFPDGGYYQNYPPNPSTPVYFLWSKVEYTIVDIQDRRIILNYNITAAEKPAKKDPLYGIIPDWFPDEDDGSLINYKKVWINESTFHYPKALARKYNQDYYVHKPMTQYSNIVFGQSVTNDFYMPFLGPEKDGYWAKTFGDTINSSSFNFDEHTYWYYIPPSDVYLRFAEDTHQTEFNISNNTFRTTLDPLVPVNSTVYGNSPTLLDENRIIPFRFGAFTWPNGNETLFGKTKNILKLQIYSVLEGICTPKCIYSQKIYKFKIKWQNASISIHKQVNSSYDEGYYNNYGYSDVYPVFDTNGSYEEQIIDNIELDFENNDNSYICWETIIECQPGQAKRLVDICVLEVRDKT